MYVKILTLALTLSYASFGVNVGWCDSCGSLWDQEDMSLRIYGEERCIGEICPDCAEYWLKVGQVQEYFKDSKNIVRTT